MTGIKDLPGMKEGEIRALGNCAVCGKRLFETPLPLFYVLTVERYGADTGAVKRRQGLDMMMGSPALARAFSPDEDLLKRLDGPKKVFVHETCADQVHHLAMLTEGQS